MMAEGRWVSMWSFLYEGLLCGWWCTVDVAFSLVCLWVVPYCFELSGPQIPKTTILFLDCTYLLLGLKMMNCDVRYDYLCWKYRIQEFHPNLNCLLTQLYSTYIWHSYQADNIVGGHIYVKHCSASIRIIIISTKWQDQL